MDTPWTSQPSIEAVYLHLRAVPSAMFASTVFRSPRTWSLKSKFALCSGALMFVFSIAFTSWTLHNVELDVHASVVDAQRALVTSTATDIDNKVDLRRDAIATIAQLLANAAPAPGLPMEEFFQPRPVLKKMFDAVMVTDAQGKVVYDYPMGSATAVLGQARDGNSLLKRAMGASNLWISSPFRSVATGVPYIAFAAPLRSKTGPVSGVLVGLLDLSHGNFIGDLGRQHIGKDGYFTLVERGSDPVFVLHRRAELIGTPAPSGADDPDVAGTLQGRAAVVEAASVSGGQALRTFRALRSVPWVLVAIYPASEAFAGLQARKREVLSVGAILFLVASAAAWLLTSWLLRPLGRLQALIGRHASDPGLRIEPERFGSAELADLVEAYNAQALARKEFEDRLYASEQRVRQIVDNMPASIVYIDKNERYVFANARVFAQRSNPGAQIIGSTLRQLRSDAGYAEIAPHVASALRGQPVNFETTESVDGQIRVSQTHFIPDHDEAGEVRGFYKLNFDITALKDAQARQALVEQRLRAITDHLPALIAHVDKDQRYDFMNDTFRVWLGIDPAASIGKHMAQVIGNEVYETRRERIARCLAGEPSGFEMEVQTLVGRKTLRIEYLPDVDSSGSIAGFYTFSADVTELKEVQLRLNRLVRSDSLTGAHNRLQFEESLPLAMARSIRSGQGMALLFLDIDYFKHINDSLGHDVGDQVLREFARRLSQCVRSTDTVARLGGDEFVVILEGLHAASEAEGVAKTIVAEMGKPIDVGKATLTVTTSIGIAFRPGEVLAVGASTFLQRADSALYVAKTQGRNRYHLNSD